MIVAFGARVVTTRGIIPVEEAMVNDEVLTSCSRFRRVLAVPTGWHDGEAHYLDGLIVTPRARLIGGFPRRSLSPNQIAQMDTVLGVKQDEWDDALRRSEARRRRGGGARAFAINVAQGAIVMGIMPAAHMAEIFFAARADSSIPLADLRTVDYRGPTASVLLRDPDGTESAVYERFVVQQAVAQAASTPASE